MFRLQAELWPIVFLGLHHNFARIFDACIIFDFFQWACQIQLQVMFNNHNFFQGLGCIFFISCIKLHQRLLPCSIGVVGIRIRRYLLIKVSSKFCIKALLPFLLGLLHIGLGFVQQPKFLQMFVAFVHQVASRLCCLFIELATFHKY